MDTDERFKKLATDPRFKAQRKKQRKVQIDDRFKSMFTDERFTLKYSKDKRGRNLKKKSGDDLKKYYHLKEEEQPGKQEDEDDPEHVSESEQEENQDHIVQTKALKSLVDEHEASTDNDEEAESTEEDEEEVEDSNSNDDDESGDDTMSGEESESDISSSSDEPETSDDEEADVHGDAEIEDPSKINYDWQPLDHDAEKAEKTYRRLAIQNLDWDNLHIDDLFVLVNSVRPPLRVRLYVSEFGKQRLAQEELEGPRELAEMPKDDEEEEELRMLEDKMHTLKEGARSSRVNHYEDADEELDPRNEKIRERIRRYQLNKMRYYYAVAEFDSVESAEAVYKELDGMEYEGSSLELDLRFVPDDVEFDEADVKAQCDKLPDQASYKAPQFINSALQQTTVKFTWDETDAKRQEMLRKMHTKQELEQDDLEAYLASGTDSDELDEDEEGRDPFSDSVSVVTANSEARVNKYKRLLQSLEEEERRKKKVDLAVDWDGDEPSDSDQSGQPSDEEQPSDDDDDDQSSDDQQASSESDEGSGADSDAEEPARMPAKRQQGRKRNQPELDEQRPGAGKPSKKSRRRPRADPEAEQDPELELLVSEPAGAEAEFKFDAEDARFDAVYHSGLYNIDPSHRSFKRTKALELMAEKKREKRRPRRA